MLSNSVSPKSDDDDDIGERQTDMRNQKVDEDLEQVNDACIATREPHNDQKF